MSSRSRPQVPYILEPSTSPPLTVPSLKDLEKAAVVLVVDASLALASEWVPVVVDYLIPYAAHLGNAQAESQFRIASVTYGQSSSRPSPILSKQWFQTLARVRDNILGYPERLGIGQAGPESESAGMAVLEGLVAGLELFDLLHESTKHVSKNNVQQRLVCHMIHVAACPPDGSRHPLWNNNSKFDHVSWDTLPAEFIQREVHYSSFLLRPIAKLRDLYSSICPIEETAAPWFMVRPHHTCLLWAPKKEIKNHLHDTGGAISIALPSPNSDPHTLSFTVPEYGFLLDQYSQLQGEINNFETAMRGGRTAEAQILQAQLVNDLPFYLNMHECFNDNLLSPLSTMSEPDSPMSLSESCSGSSNPDYDQDSDSVRSASVFNNPDASSSEESLPLCQRGPFGTNLTEFPSRVITKMRSLQGMDSPILGGSSWQGDFNWAGSDPATGARKCMTIGVYGLNATGSRDLRSNTWPEQIVLVPSQYERVPEHEFQSWIKKYDPMWCQFVPSVKPDTDSTLNDIVFRQVVGRLTDQNLYALASWYLPNGGPEMRNNLILIPFGISGLIGAVFSSVGKPELPRPKKPRVVENATLANFPLHYTVIRHYLSVWCDAPPSLALAYISDLGSVPAQSEDEKNFMAQNMNFCLQGIGHPGDYTGKLDVFSGIFSGLTGGFGEEDFKMVKLLESEGALSSCAAGQSSMAQIKEIFGGTSSGGDGSDLSLEGLDLEDAEVAKWLASQASEDEDQQQQQQQQLSTCKQQLLPEVNFEENIETAKWLAAAAAGTQPGVGAFIEGSPLSS